MEREKLERLARIVGYDTSDDLLAESASDSIVPAICVNAGCDYVDPMEPDAQDGWCPVCETHTVKSCLVLAGMI